MNICLKNQLGILNFLTNCFILFVAFLLQDNWTCTIAASTAEEAESGTQVMIIDLLIVLLYSLLFF